MDLPSSRPNLEIAPLPSSAAAPADPPASGKRPAGKGARVRSEQQRSLETRAALLKTAREQFGSVGYHATGIGDLAERTRVTRGALYHHFASKQDVFETVCRQIALELDADARASTQAMQGQTLQRAIATLRIYLQFFVTRRDVQRIMLIDAPAVLGWERLKALRAEFDLAGWVTTLRLLQQAGQLGPAPIDALAHILVAAIDEAILSIAHAEAPEIALNDMAEALGLLLLGLVGSAPAASGVAPTRP